MKRGKEDGKGPGEKKEEKAKHTKFCDGEEGEEQEQNAKSTCRTQREVETAVPASGSIEKKKRKWEERKWSRRSAKRKGGKEKTVKGTDANSGKEEYKGLSWCVGREEPDLLI